MRKVKQNQNFTCSPFTLVVYVIQYHLAAAEAELVNIENQMDPEGGAVSSVPAEAGEHRLFSRRTVGDSLGEQDSVAAGEGTNAVSVAFLPGEPEAIRKAKRTAQA